MRLLIDTAVALWVADDAPHLSPMARSLIADPENEVVLSVVTPWEVAIKSALAKLDVPRDLGGYFGRMLAALSMTVLPIELRHGLAVRELPHIHADPFDRLLIVQAQIEGLTLVTPDTVIARYDVETAW